MRSHLYSISSLSKRQELSIRRWDDKQHESTALENPDPGFNGLWRSPNGSLYMFEGDCFICVSVYSSRFMVWLNKVAVKDIRKAGDQWIGIQAFREFETGAVTEWVDITLELQNDKVIKHFPTHIPRDILVHGYIEVYNKVRIR